MKPFFWRRRAGALALCTALLGGTAALAAGVTYQTIRVQYSGIQMVVDGVPVTPKDANGVEIEPFVYNGTTYLPVRAVGEAIGKPVTWEGKTQTVYIGEAPGQALYLLDLCPPYQTDQYEAPATFTMGGNTYAHGFTLKIDGYALFNLNGQYQVLELDVGHIKGNTCDTNVNIYLDGTLTQNLSFKAEDLPRHVSIPLNGALQLKIERTLPDGVLGNTSLYGFANAKLIR